jgi:hypothetical protein
LQDGELVVGVRFRGVPLARDAAAHRRATTDMPHRQRTMMRVPARWVCASAAAGRWRSTGSGQPRLTIGRLVGPARARTSRGRDPAGLAGWRRRSSCRRRRWRQADSGCRSCLRCTPQPARAPWQRRCATAASQRRRQSRQQAATASREWKKAARAWGAMAIAQARAPSIIEHRTPDIRDGPVVPERHPRHQIRPCECRYYIARAAGPYCSRGTHADGGGMPIIISPSLVCHM